MSVYLVFFGVDYEGSSVEGVFETREKAQAFIEELKPKLLYAWHDQGWESLGNDEWRHRDKTLVIKEEEVQ